MIKNDNDKKPIVLMYYAFPDKVGGPITYINTIIDSHLKERFEFKTLFQNKAPGGLDLRLLREMVKGIKEIHPDIVHVHGAQSEGFYGVLASRIAGIKRIVLTIHGFAFDNRQSSLIKKTIYRYFVEPITIRFATKVYCVCEFASKRKIIVNNAGKRNFGYIHNPAPEKTASIERETARESLGFGQDDIVFCTSGRVTYDKGFEIIEQIVRGLTVEEKQRFRLICLGDGPYYSEFTDNLKGDIDAGIIRMMGRVENVENYLVACDVFLFPSYHENLSIALLEAEKAGLTSIVSEVGGNTEIVRDGFNGFVVKNQSVDDYLSRIRNLMHDRMLLNRMRNAAKQDVENRFNTKTICEEIGNVYDKCLEE